MSTPETEQKVKEPVKPSSRVYCRWEVTDENLKAMFEKVGKVTEARVVRGPRLKAFGFVTFESEAEAAKAIEQINGKVLASPMTVEFAASERGARRKRPSRVPAQPQPGPAAPAASQPAPARRAPRGQGEIVTPTGGAPGAPAPRPRRRRNRHTAEKKDPNWGKVVILNPDPISNPLAKEAQIVELQAGPREYRPGVSQGKTVSSLILNADPTKGPFNCDFKLGEFDLKLLSVKVTSRPGDVKIGARILYPAGNRSREVYLRVRPNTVDNRHKFFELVKPGTDLTQPAEVFFVGLDSILLEPNTGLWKKIVLSLVSAVVPPRPPRVPVQPAVVPPPAAAPAPATR